MVARHQCQMELCHCGCTYIAAPRPGEARMSKMGYLLECPGRNQMGIGRRERNRVHDMEAQSAQYMLNVESLSIVDEAISCKRMES